MSIIFLILKIAGIIILIPLVILVILLICPIAYRLEAEFDGKPHVKTRIRWAFPLIGMKASYEEELDVAVRILGIPVFRTDSGKWSLLGGDRKDSVVKEVRREDPPQEREPVSDSRERFRREPQEEETERDEPVTDIFDLAWDEDEPEQERAEKNTPGEQEEKGRKKIGERFVDFFKKCYNKGKNILNKIKKLKAKGISVLELLEDEQLQAAFARIKGYFLRGAGYLIPQKIEGEILFGMEDPAQTGKILGRIAMAMPLYGNRLDVTPDFTRQVLEGRILIAGRIRRYKILKLAWDIYRDKDLIRQKNRAVKIVGG